MATSAVDIADLSHDNLRTQALAINYLFPSIGTVAVALRLYSRSLTRSFGSDDWVICIALVLYWAETYTSHEVILLDFIGFHVWDIPDDMDPAMGAKFAFVSELLYNPILALVRTSIFLFLFRLTGQKVNIRRTIIGLLIFNVLMTVIIILLTIFHCVPIAANWYPAKYPNAVCLNFEGFVSGTAAVSVFTDALALLLPTWIVYDLQINQRQKLMLIGILSFGLITVIVGIIRIALFADYSEHPPPDYNYSLLYCITTIELGLSFICACAPAFKPIVVLIIPKFFGDSSRSRSAKKSVEGFAKGRTGKRPEGYELSRRTPLHTAEDGAPNMPTGDYDAISDKNESPRIGKMRIAVRTDTEVKWQDYDVSVNNGRQARKSGCSTESLV